MVQANFQNGASVTLENFKIFDLINGHDFQFDFS